MFAGNTAAAVDAFLQYLMTCFQHALHLIGIAFVEEQNRVDIAVACVKDVWNAKALLGTGFANELHDLGKF